MINNVESVSLLQFLAGPLCNQNSGGLQSYKQNGVFVIWPPFFVPTHLNYSQWLHVILTTVSAVFVQIFYPKQEWKQWRLLNEFIKGIFLLWCLWCEETCLWQMEIEY